MINILWLLISLCAVFAAFYYGCWYQLMRLAVWHNPIKEPDMDRLFLWEDWNETLHMGRLTEYSSYVEYKIGFGLKRWAYVSDIEKLPEVKKSS